MTYIRDSLIIQRTVVRFGRIAFVSLALYHGFSGHFRRLLDGSVYLYFPRNCDEMTRSNHLAGRNLPGKPLFVTGAKTLTS